MWPAACDISALTLSFLLPFSPNSSQLDLLNSVYLCPAQTVCPIAISSFPPILISFFLFLLSFSVNSSLSHDVFFCLSPVILSLFCKLGALVRRRICLFGKNCVHKSFKILLPIILIIFYSLSSAGVTWLFQLHILSHFTCIYHHYVLVHSSVGRCQ